MSFQNCKIAGIGVNSDLYHCQMAENRGSEDFIMSPSSLKLFMECPSRWKSGYQPPDSDAKDFGSLLDTLLLTPEQFEDRYAIKPATYPADGKKGEQPTEKPWSGNATWCRQWIEAQGDKCVVSKTELENAQTAAKRLMADETIAELIGCSDKQVHVKGEWLDKATGVVIPVQCLIDLVPKPDSAFQKSLCDLKTTRNASQRPFARWCFTAGYHIQAAFDLALFMAAVNPKNDQTGQDRCSWLFIVQENYPPYEIGRRSLAPDFIDIGKLAYQDALSRYARCLKTGLWPQYDEDEAFTMIAPEPFMAYESLSDHLESESLSHETEESDGEIAP